MSTDILVVDDEADIRELVAGILEDEGHGTRTAANSDQALEAINERRPGLIFLDIWLQGSKLDGLALLDVIYKDHPNLPIVIISGHGNIETAVSAIKRGAYDYIEKPFKADRLVLVAQRALEASRLRKEVAELKHRSGESIDLIGSSSTMHQLRQTVERVAPTNSRVMIFGASGAGKERVARAIHAGSRRANGPFVVLSSASITPETMEIALFGTESANGQGRRVGALEEAHGGILYLDEVADMPRETQSKILRVLVDQTFERVGGSKKVKVDVRILSSTARDLESEIKEGHFREDLFHRLAVVPIRVPSLAERREDVPELVDYFMAQLGQTSGLPVRSIADDAMAVLQAHDWPGNLRQLKNNVERLMILTQGDPEATVTAAMLPPEIGEILPATPSDGSAHIMSLPLREAREVFEREYLSAQINRFGGNISRTAEFVGMERSALHRKLKSLGV